MALDDQQRMLRYRENALSPSNVLFPEEDWYAQYGMPAPGPETPDQIDRRQLLEDLRTPIERTVPRTAPPPMSPEADIAGAGGGVSAPPITAPPKMGSLEEFDRRIAERDALIRQGPPKPSWWRYPVATAVGAYAGPHAGRAVLYPGYDRQVGLAGKQAESALARAKSEQEGQRATAYSEAQGALAKQRQQQGEAARYLSVPPPNRVVKTGPSGAEVVIQGQPEPAKQPENLIGYMTRTVMDTSMDPTEQQKRMEFIAKANRMMTPEQRDRVHVQEVTDEPTGNVTTRVIDTTNNTVVFSDVMKGVARKRPPEGAMVGGQLSKEGLARVNTISDNMRQDPDLKLFSDVRNAYDVIQRASRGGGVEDLTLLRAYALITDPRTGVREGEFDTMETAQGALIRRGVRIVPGMVTGERLTDEARKSFVKNAKDRYQIYKRAADTKIEFYRNQAKSAGVSPDLVVNQVQSEEADQGESIQKWERDSQGRLVRVK